MGELRMAGRAKRTRFKEELLVDGQRPSTRGSDVEDSVLQPARRRKTLVNIY